MKACVSDSCHCRPKAGSRGATRIYAPPCTSLFRGSSAASVLYGGHTLFLRGSASLQDFLADKGIRSKCYLERWDRHREGHDTTCRVPRIITSWGEQPCSNDAGGSRRIERGEWHSHEPGPSNRRSPQAGPIATRTHADCHTGSRPKRAADCCGGDAGRPQEHGWKNGPC